MNGYESADLDPKHTAALRLADALMSQPGSIDEGLVVELRRYFSVDEITELTLDVMKWNYQKVAVALRTDVEVSPGELADLIFDEDGHWVRP